MPAPQMPLDVPRLPDNRQPFPASPNAGGNSYMPYHPDLTPPPNVFGPYRNPNYVTTTREPSLLHQFLNNKNSSPKIDNANLNLTLFGVIVLFIYRFQNFFVIVDWNAKTHDDACNGKSFFAAMSFNKKDEFYYYLKVLL